MHLKEFADKRIHMIGIGGSSMSGLAEMLLSEGFCVTGSDRTHSHAVERLEQKGIEIHIGHNAESVHGAGLIVFSAAIGPENPERMEAERLGIPRMERSVLLGELMGDSRHSICIAGAHGKTTTSAMISKVFLDAGKDPSVSIGGRLDAIGGGSRNGKKDFFIAEACEFNRSFLQMHPTCAIVLNIDEDHLDCYGDIEHIEQAFNQFVHLLPPEGMAIGWGDDPRVRRILSTLVNPCYTFGSGEENDFSFRDLRYTEELHPSFTVCFHGDALAEIDLSVPGFVNALNALAAFAAAYLHGIEIRSIVQSLNSFSGVHRRFELTGVIDGVKLYHDYGHNPAEMQKALEMAKAQHPKKLWAVMQPHTYSRVKTLFEGYLTCTALADCTLVTEICAAREKDPGDINSSMLVDGMNQNGVKAVLTPTFDDTENYLRAHWHPGDLVITLGCGDINLLNEQIGRHGDTNN